MAKSILLNFQGESSAFAFTRLDRAKLYGFKERHVVDTQNQRCFPAYLTSDGTAMVPSGGLAMLYVMDNFDTIERADLQSVNAEGELQTLKPSTLGEEQNLQPATPADLLDHLIHTVYELTPETLGSALHQALQQGAIFTAPFAYRDDYQYQTLFLLKGKEALFGLLGEPSGFTFLQRDAILPSESITDESDDLSDDLDFGMM